MLAPLAAHRPTSSCSVARASDPHSQERCKRPQKDSHEDGPQSWSNAMYHFRDNTSSYSFLKCSSDISKIGSYMNEFR